MNNHQNILQNVRDAYIDFFEQQKLSSKIRQKLSVLWTSDIFLLTSYFRKMFINTQNVKVIQSPAILFDHNLKENQYVVLQHLLLDVTVFITNFQCFGPAFQTTDIQLYVVRFIQYPIPYFNPNQ